MKGLEYSFSLGPTVGKGATGVVRMAEHVETAMLYACKSVTGGENPVLEARAEIEAMKRVGGHPNIVTLHQFFEAEKAVHLILDLCSGGDLCDYLVESRGRPESTTAFIFWQVGQALSHCHSKGLVHRDVRPENMMLATAAKGVGGKRQMLVKLADFGTAVCLRDGERVSGVAGSKAYMAPEVSQRHPYGAKADMWSLGVSLFCALAGHFPFPKQDNSEVTDRLPLSPKYKAKTWAKISPDAKSLVEALLQRDPERRLSAVEFLQHPWIAKYRPPTDVSLNDMFTSRKHLGRLKLTIKEAKQKAEADRLDYIASTWPRRTRSRSLDMTNTPLPFCSGIIKASSNAASSSESSSPHARSIALSSELHPTKLQPISIPPGSSLRRLSRSGSSNSIDYSPSGSSRTNVGSPKPPKARPPMPSSSSVLETRLTTQSSMSRPGSPAGSSPTPLARMMTSASMRRGFDEHASQRSSESGRTSKFDNMRAGDASRSGLSCDESTEFVPVARVIAPPPIQTTKVAVNRSSASRYVVTEDVTTSPAVFPRETPSLLSLRSSLAHPPSSQELAHNSDAPLAILLSSLPSDARPESQGTSKQRAAPERVSLPSPRSRRSQGSESLSLHAGSPTEIHTPPSALSGVVLAAHQSDISPLSSSHLSSCQNSSFSLCQASLSQSSLSPQEASRSSRPNSGPLITSSMHSLPVRAPCSGIASIVEEEPGLETASSPSPSFLRLASLNISDSSLMATQSLPFKYQTRGVASPKPRIETTTSMPSDSLLVQMASEVSSPPSSSTSPRLTTSTSWESLNMSISSASSSPRSGALPYSPNPRPLVPKNSSPTSLAPRGRY